MKQKIVIQMDLDCDKCRSKALMIGAKTEGVSSVSLEGEMRDQVVVTGEVDAVYLVRELRKKLQGVILLSVEEVKEEDIEKEKEKENEKENEQLRVGHYPYPLLLSPSAPYNPNYIPVYDSYGSHPNCSIM